MAIGTVHQHMATRAHAEPGGPHAPAGSFANAALLWRLALIALIPISVWLLTVALYDRIPQSAGNLHYDVVVNKITGDACIDVKNEPLPKALTDVGC